MVRRTNRLILLLALALPSCSDNETYESTSRWKYSENRDQMRDAVVDRSATLPAEGVDKHVKRLVITSIPGDRLRLALQPNIKFALEQTCFDSGTVNVRVNDKPVKTVKCEVGGIALSIDPILVEDLKSSSSIWIETFNPVIGSEQSRFEPQGLDLSKLSFEG